MHMLAMVVMVVMGLMVVIVVMVMTQVLRRDVMHMVATTVLGIICRKLIAMV